MKSELPGKGGGSRSRGSLMKDGSSGGGEGLASLVSHHPTPSGKYTLFNDIV